MQLAVAPVGEAQLHDASRLVERATRDGLRAELLAEGSLASRVREAARRKVPYVAVIGAREAAGGKVALRLHGRQDHVVIAVEEALALVRSAVASRSQR